MTKAALEPLLRALADGRSLADAAEAAGVSPDQASTLLKKLADQKKPRASARKNQMDLELPTPPRKSPFPAGQVPVAYADGASRGNPGPAAYGCVYGVEGTPLCAEGETIGVATNNVAEYRGAIAALERLRDWKVGRAILRLDSQLVVKQLDGSYRVKDAKLKPLYARAKALAAQLDRVQFQHVPRAENALADQAANQALDR